MKLELKLNEDLKERKMGYIFGAIWLAILIFYMTWDGWLYEWLECGYDGPNMHFDLDMFDMQWEIVNGEIVYYSTNNLHNIIYLCYVTFAFGVLALLTGNERLKHSAMALLPFPVMATMATLNPYDRLFVLQNVYDLVHLSGIIIGIYLFYKMDIDVKKAAPAIFFTWIIFFLSRILMQKWPYWAEGHEIGYFSVNQINDMPFYAYGFEYVIVVVLLFVINFVVAKILEKISGRIWKAVFPVALYSIVLLILNLSGLITLQNISLGTCP